MHHDSYKLSVADFMAIAGSTRPPRGWQAVRPVIALLTACCLWGSAACGKSSQAPDDSRTMKEWARDTNKRWVPKNADHILPQDEIAQRSFDRILKNKSPNARLSVQYLRKTADSVVKDEIRRRHRHSKYIQYAKVQAEGYSPSAVRNTQDAQIAKIELDRLGSELQRWLRRIRQNLEEEKYQRAVKKLGEGKSLHSISRELSAENLNAGRRTIKRWLRKDIPEKLRANGLVKEADLLGELYEDARPQRGRKPKRQTTAPTSVHKRGLAFLREWLSSHDGCIPWPDCQGPTASTSIASVEQSVRDISSGDELPDEAKKNAIVEDSFQLEPRLISTSRTVAIRELAQLAQADNPTLSDVIIHPSPGLAPAQLASSPRVFSPRVFSPRIFSPRIFSPRIFSPRIFSPRGLLVR